MQKFIFYLYCTMLFLVPLVMWPYTSEVFEFNKMVTVYIFTTLIVGTWIARCITEEKIIFHKTILDLPLLVFLGSQTISTILSLDPLVSFYGYYSRFNGGLLSIVCYSLLYWAFVSNLTKSYTLYVIRFMLFSAVLVSIYGVLEHFGIDKDIWVQDVQSRVFSTLGQPNWLAAWLVALLPLTFTPMLNNKKINAKFFGYLGLSILFFVTLLFTKSRSGLLGIAVADIIFWIFNLINEKGKSLKSFLIYHLAFAFLALVIGTQFTPSLQNIIKKTNTPAMVSTNSGNALETGGTESGTIRKIVWKGAFEVFKSYPIIGTGLETFAFSYYKNRPVEHNMVSEWDYVYNKAHNEFLNTMANSGFLGIVGYLYLLTTTCYLFIKHKKYEFLAGYIGLTITNFFGFSVVPTQLQLFLFPAMAYILNDEK